jgi:DNA-binding response OmpR family regulator
MTQPASNVGPHHQSYSRRIMVVDDDDDSLHQMAAAFAARDYEVRCSQDALEATLLAAEFRPHVAIIDIRLPGMDGHELMTWLRAHPELSETLFIAITGSTEKWMAKRSAEVGFHFHLTKPVDMRELVGIVAGRCRRSGPAGGGASHLSKDAST